MSARQCHFLHDASRGLERQRAITTLDAPQLPSVDERGAKPPLNAYTIATDLDPRRRCHREPSDDGARRENEPSDDAFLGMPELPRKNVEADADERGED